MQWGCLWGDGVTCRAWSIQLLRSCCSVFCEEACRRSVLYAYVVGWFSCSFAIVKILRFWCVVCVCICMFFVVFLVIGRFCVDVIDC